MSGADAVGDRQVPRWAVALIVGWLVVSRFAFLDVDPPAAIDQSFLSDEGWWSHNAKLRTVFGAWILDEHNPPLFAAPLYTVALLGVYEVLGVGLWETRFLAALSGLVSVWLVYGIVRRMDAPRTAWIAAGLVAADYFTTLHQRVAFVESFQLVWILVAVRLFLAGGRLPMVLSGIAFALAVLSKLSAVALGFVFAAAWLVEAYRERRVGPALRAAVAFGLGAGVTLGAVVVVLAIPHWADIQKELHSNYVQASRDGLLRSTLNLGRFGLEVDAPGAPGQVATNHFLGQTVVLIGLLAVVLLRTITADGARAKADALTRLCWCWLAVGGVFVGMQFWQPDRRYLFLLPPIVILVARMLTAGAEVPLAPLARAGWRRWLAAAVVATFAGLYLRAPLVGTVQQALREAERFVPHPRILGIGTWLLVVAVLTPLLVVVVKALARHRLRVPAAAVAVALLLLGPIRLTVDVLAAPRTMVAATERLDRLAIEHGVTDRAVVGDVADTLTLGTGLLPIVVRDWPHIDMFMNLDAWERFEPGLVLAGEPPPAGAGRFEELEPLRLCPLPDGTPRLIVRVFVRAR